MLDQLIALTSKLYLWQVAVIVSIVLLALGFTGGIPYTDIVLLEHHSLLAVKVGFTFFIFGMALKFLADRNN